MKSASKLAVEIVQRVLRLPRPFKIALATILLLLLLVLIYPFQIVIVPEWNLRVVDNSDQAIAGINVTEHWQHYLLEPEGHDEVKISGGDGSVTFPERTIRAGLLSRFFAKASKTFRKGQEARTDCHGSIVVWGSRDHETATSVYRPPGPLQNRVVVRRQ
ncbi:MAG: hypothetical protein ACRD6N_18365 [Pyrinomonadaceae bacterium]